MPNHLARESSPYLLQHANNPVDWYPWGPVALEKARREDKPIFLSIGYAACHWCHVMAHESFENPQIAALMNDNFVNIKVDREERPDLDNIYMSAVTAMTGQGGWPMSLFLTPDGKPFYGGTYFPPVRRYNMPSFQEVLESVARVWQQNRQEILQSGQQIADHLRQANEAGVLEEKTGRTIQPEVLKEATISLGDSYDWQNGGWGQAPKFPQPMAIEFLLRRATRGDKQALDMALHALRMMAKGGMYDLVGGGFARYSTDARWLVPHFEKMLYDNAQLAQVYLHAYLLTREAEFGRVCEQTLDFVMREMTNPQGGFYSSLDADSEGVEGKYYVWDEAEIRELIPKLDDFALFNAAFPVSSQGNFEGKNILQRLLSDQELAERFQLPADLVQNRLDEMLHRLFERRQERVRPGTDDKVLVSWNGLMLVAFAEAARYLHRADYLSVAIKNASFLLSALVVDGKLMRSWRDGKASQAGFLEDYAGLVLGLLAIYESNPDLRWYQAAIHLLDEMNAHFQDSAGGYFDTSDEAEELLLRPKESQDNATPSGNALAAQALLLCSAYTGNGDWHEQAESMLASMQSMAARYPTAFGKWLQALDLAVGPLLEIAILGNFKSDETRKLVATLWSTYRPRLVAAISELPVPPEAPPLLFDRPLYQGKPTAYVCQGFACKMPVNEAEALEAELNTGEGG